MATWVKCTNSKGEVVFANLDHAIVMAQRGVRKETTIQFTGLVDTLDVKETPEDLIASLASSRGMRRTDIS